MKTPVSQTLDNCFAKMANAMSKQNTYNNCLYISLNAYRGRGVSYNLATTLHTRLSEINASSETKEQIKQSQKLFEGSYFKNAQHGFVLLDKASSALPSLLDDLLGEKQHWSSKQRQKLKSLEDIMTMASSGEKEHEHIRLFVASPQAVNSPQKTESTYKNWQQALTTTPTAQTCYRFEYWATPASGGGSCQTHKTLYATTVDDLITHVALFLIEKKNYQAILSCNFV